MIQLKIINKSMTKLKSNKNMTNKQNWLKLWKTWQINKIKIIIYLITNFIVILFKLINYGLNQKLLIN